MLLLASVVLVSFPQIEVVKAQGSIYIREDGSVEGTDKIQRDGDVYTFTDNIGNQSVVVEKDDVIIDGAGFSIEGKDTSSAQPENYGILVERINNVTIRNVAIRHFLYGLFINGSFRNRITNCKIISNTKGIVIEDSSDNMIRESQITDNFDVGIYVFKSSDTHILDNIVADNTKDGISLFLSENNEVTYCEIRDNRVGLRIMNSSIEPLVYSCNITSNQVGIYLEASLIHIQFNNIETNGIGIKLDGSDNRIDRNNFIDNTKQVYDTAWDNPEMSPSINTWYDGDSGNYCRNYNGTGDTPYIIDENNQYPLPKNTPFRFPNEPFPHRIEEDFTISNIIWSIIILAVIGTAFFIYFRRTKNTVKISQ